MRERPASAKRPAGGRRPAARWPDALRAQLTLALALALVLACGAGLAGGTGHANAATGDPNAATGDALLRHPAPLVLSDRAMEPLDPPVALGGDDPLYTHFGTITALPDGSLVYAGMKGRGHSARDGGSDIVVHRSTDRGRSWSAPIVVAEGLVSGRTHRAPRLGTTTGGQALLVYVEDDGSAGVPIDDEPGPFRLVQRRSTDGLRWSEPSPMPIEGGNPSNPRGSQMIVYGPIERIGPDQLGAMAYLGPLNYFLTGDGDARRWRIHAILDERELFEGIDVNEMSFEALDAGTGTGGVLAIARLGGARSAFLQLASPPDPGLDGRWRPIGPLPIPASGGYASTDLTTVGWRGRRYVLASVMHRAPRDGSDRRSDARRIHVLCAPLPLSEEPPAWRSVGYVDAGLSLSWRSGYSTALGMGGELVMALHDERTETDSDAYVVRFALSEVLGANGERCAPGGMAGDPEAR